MVSVERAWPCFICPIQSCSPKGDTCQDKCISVQGKHGRPNISFFSPSQLSKAEKVLGLSRGETFTTVYQAFYQVNLQKHWNYWNPPFPHGITDVRVPDLIDLDKCGIFLKTANRSTGKAYVGAHTNEKGPYSKSEKWALLMAISGEVGTPEPPSMRWRSLWLDGETTNDRYLSFIQEILQDLVPGRPEICYCFTMGNLNAYHSVVVQTMIHAAGHKIVFRSPYHACDGPIEYVFNTLQCILKSNLHHIYNGPSLINQFGNANFCNARFNNINNNLFLYRKIFLANHSSSDWLM